MNSGAERLSISLKEGKVVASLMSGFNGLLGPADLEQEFLMFIKRSMTVLKRNVYMHTRE